MSDVVLSQTNLAKYNGKVHNRKDELRSYRKMIDRANENLEKAVNQGKYEEADYWSKTIDATQARITGIIEQEDKHTYQKPKIYEDYVVTTTNGVDSLVNSGTKVVDTGIKVVETIPKTVISGAIGSMGDALDTVA